MVYECMLTTVDNPFDPFEQFDPWFMFDVEKGYYSCSRLARILEKNGFTTFEGLSQKEIDAVTEDAIDEIIKYDITNTYKKVKRQLQSI